MQKLNILFTNSAPLIKYGLADTFHNMGHEVFICQNEFQLWGKTKEEQIVLFEKIVEQFKPDFVFSECFAEFSENIFIHTRNKGIPHFYWAIEDTPFDHWLGDYWSYYADHTFTTTAECLMNYWSKDRKASLLPFGVNKNFHKPTDFNSKYAHDIVLVGTNYDRRENQAIEYYYPIIKQGYDFKIFGNSAWMDENRKCNLNWTPDTYGGLMPYEKLDKLYSSSKVILGAQCDIHSYTQMSMRNFEVLGWAGNSAIMISPYSPAQEFLFGDHIYLPKSPQEMLDMVGEVIKMSDEQRISKAKEAQEFVYRYHSYEIRANAILDIYYKQYGN